ncbi:unnamed protein product [Brassica oleracea]
MPGEFSRGHRSSRARGAKRGRKTTARAEIQRQNRRLAAIRLDLKRPIRKKTAPKIKVAAKLREKYAKERFARKDDPKDDGASGAAAVN